jgi:hypothetical protein
VPRRRPPTVRRLALALGGLLALVLAEPAAAQVHLEPVGTFTAPVAVSAPPGDTTRVIVVERGGSLVLIKGGARQATPFLSVPVATDGERGLLSMAFAPDYATSGLFYIFFVAPGTGQLRIEERRRDAANPDIAAAGYARLVLGIPHGLQNNHNGGQLQFGPDGLLYVGTGDGGGAGDPYDNGQRLSGNPAGDGRNPLLGKLLRIDPRSAMPYAVPAGNPFTAPNAPEIWSYGLRNPWRFSFDRVTGDLIVGDVGQNSWEEIDFAPAASGGGRGSNFGWDDFEGTHTFDGGGAAAVGPVIEHGHGAGWCSITGGYVVRDPALSELTGQYVYGDYCLGKVYAATLSAGGASGVRDLGLPTVPALTGFGEDACGRVYVASLSGPVYRLASSGACSTSAPAAPTAARDTRPPLLSVAVARRQRVLRKGHVALQVRCDERCALRASGHVQLWRPRAARAAADRPLPTGVVRRTLFPSARTSLRLHVGPRTRARVRWALRRPNHAATVRVALTASDLAGNRSERRVSVRIRR